MGEGVAYRGEQTCVFSLDQPAVYHLVVLCAYFDVFVVWHVKVARRLGEHAGGRGGIEHLGGRKGEGVAFGVMMMRER